MMGGLSLFISLSFSLSLSLSPLSLCLCLYLSSVFGVSACLRVCGGGPWEERGGLVLINLALSLVIVCVVCCVCCVFVLCVCVFCVCGVSLCVCVCVCLLSVSVCVSVYLSVCLCGGEVSFFHVFCSWWCGPGVGGRLWINLGLCVCVCVSVCLLSLCACGVCVCFVRVVCESVCVRVSGVWCIVVISCLSTSFPGRAFPLDPETLSFSSAFYLNHAHRGTDHYRPIYAPRSLRVSAT